MRPRLSFAAFAVVTLVSTSDVFADNPHCPPGSFESLELTPASGDELPANGRIVVTAGGDQRDLLLEFERVSVALVADDRNVKLELAERHDTGLILQLVLQPAERLEEGKTYRFRVEDEVSERWAWTIVEADDAPPRWTEPPSVADTRIAADDSDPEAVLDLSIVATDEESDWFVRVERERVDGDGSGESLLTKVPDDGPLSVGRTLCSGTFEWEVGVTYRVTLELVDVAGHRVPAPVDPFEITM